MPLLRASGNGRQQKQKEQRQRHQQKTTTIVATKNKRVFCFPGPPSGRGAGRRRTPAAEGRRILVDGGSTTSENGGIYLIHFGGDIAGTDTADNTKRYKAFWDRCFYVLVDPKTGQTEDVYARDTSGSNLASGIGGVAPNNETDAHDSSNSTTTLSSLVLSKQIEVLYVPPTTYFRGERLPRSTFGRCNFLLSPMPWPTSMQDRPT
mmetsp:Transcript_19363/g.39811  ORF Transcript_19363/g.39811 Transcript_19363/m.39811 type:complete len:206 (-) Transcript_19363:83-700(-)